MAIYFYLPREPNGWLSNFSPHGVALDDAVWPTVEHYFQAAKFVTHQIPPTPTPSGARRARATPPTWAARDRRHPLRADWEQVKEDVMRRAVRQKFESHAEIAALLLDSGDEELVEASPVDSYWGAGQDGSGRNRLGHILMEVRAALRALHALPPSVVQEAPTSSPRKRRK